DRKVEEIVAAAKLPDGQIVYLTNIGKCIRLDAAGKAVKTFESGWKGESGCELQLTSRGGLLVSECPKRTLAQEFDLEGKSLWQTSGPVVPGILTEARNGRLVAAVWDAGAVVELDRNGATVWRYEVPGFNPFLARKR